MRRSPATTLMTIASATGLMVGAAGCAPTATRPGPAIAGTIATTAVAPVVVAEQRDPAGRLVLPVNTAVPLTIDAELASNKARVGDTFSLTVERDVMAGATVVIPRGTHAVGMVSKRSGKGTLGKSGKMEVEIRSLDLNGRVVALTGSGRQAGKGNGAATLGTLLLFGPFAAAVTGTSARFHKGRAFTAHTHEPIVVDAPPSAPATAPTT